jgi:hypothetical protein
LLMLFQSYSTIFPLTIYIAIVMLFIIAIVFSILFTKELTAVVGIFLFSMVVRLMYFVSTRFSVFPYGDPYSQYSVLQEFSQSSHVSILHASSFINFLAVVPHQYSEWPGFQVFALSLSRITNLPLFWTALTVPFMLYGIWFVLSYAIVRKIFEKFSGKSSVLSVVSLAVASAFPTFELPPEYKYDFMAAILLLAVTLLLMYPLERHIFEKSILFVVMISAIVITHSLTALFLVMLMTLLGVAFIIRAYVPMMPRFARYLPQASKSIRSGPLLKLVVLALAAVAIWWTYYATFAETYASVNSSFIFRSFSLQFLSLARVGGQTGSMLGSLTPSWLIHLLHYRDDFLLALLGVGALVLIIRPTILGKRLMIVAILLSIGVATIVTEAFRTLNFGDRAFLTFAPILACFVVMPVAAMTYLNPKVGKIGALVLMFFFLFSIGLGFWGSSYAPVFLYSNQASAYSYGEHPLNWEQVGNYMNYATSSNTNSAPRCILTNEIYVTSLAIPTQWLNRTYTFPNIRIAPGYVSIIYDSLTHFNDSYVSEPLVPYKATNPQQQNFSDSALSNTLSNNSDLIFSGGNTTIYFTLGETGNTSKPC